MSVSITGYSKIKLSETVSRNDDGDYVDTATGALMDYDDFISPWVNTDFPTRAEDIQSKKVYSYGEAVDGGDWFYGGYNRMRTQLAVLGGLGIPPYGAGDAEWQAWFTQAEGRSFFEIVYFSDCEGTLGTAVCKKLAIDFAFYQEKADEIRMQHFGKFYAELRAVIDAGADDGCVIFS